MARGYSPGDLGPQAPNVPGEGGGALSRQDRLDMIDWAKEKYGYPSAQFDRWYRETFGPAGGAGAGIPVVSGGEDDDVTGAFDPLGPVPEAEPLSMDEMRRYALGEMDVQARAAALQAGAASQRLGGLNPAARTMALSEISRGGSGMVGQGVGQAAAMANQSNLASYQGQMQNRMTLSNAIQQSLNQGYAMQQIGAQHQNAMQMAQMQYDLQRRNQRKGGGFWGALGGIAGTVLGGPIGGALGGWVGGKFGGGGQQQQQQGYGGYGSVYGGQRPYHTQYGSYG